MNSSPRNGAKVFFADTSALLYLEEAPLAAAMALFRQVSGVFLTLDRRQYRVARALVPT
ncbi:hypothetical protein [Thermus islandicus]|uniref:hypothetical protein n=1 Tax=Thermus islandicus TaxID=540988 RepID=UPI0003B4E924|nr:hypothetical protein [Thermus islandicus]